MAEEVSAHRAKGWRSPVKQNAPRLLGRVLSASSCATIAAYGVVFLVWRWLGHCLSLLVPRDPNAGNETIFATRRLPAAAAE
jgi:hypothetical protein